MKAIGIRVSPKIIYYCIANSTLGKVEINVDCINVPLSLEAPEKYRFLRQLVLDIINTYQITHAGIRICENKPGANIDDARIAMEAIIQETIAASSVHSHYVGRIAKITSLLEIPKREFLDSVQGTGNPMNIDGWANYAANEKESILTSLAALNI